MDVHIHLSYCTASGFRTLASNYLGIHESNPHHLCGEIEGLIKSVEVTPAAVAEELMKSDDADVVLEGLLNLLKEKKATNDEKKLKKAKKAEEERTKKGEEERIKKAEEDGTNNAERQERDEVANKNC
jgi:chaperone BCS1